jgi:outer membrane protein OmpA-like peptidoglycan-associated protein
MDRLTLRACGLALAFVAITGVGCATKKYVRQTVSPVQARVDELEKKNAAQDGSITELGRGLSATDERAKGADGKAVDAARDAARANDQAALAGKQASAAQTVAESGVSRATAAEHAVGDLGNKVERMDNFKLATAQNVLFDLAQSKLSKEALSLLDALAEKVGPLKHYVIEVQGFTDSTGAPETNLRLSERRAAEVVRYLTLERKIPLFRVNVMGYGAANPASENKTRAGRQQNRRVQVSLFVPDLGS